MVSLILGLGNIGDRYAKTRHNVGFDVLELVATELKARRRASTDYYEWAEATGEERAVILARPTTFMNRSGLAAAALLARFGLEPAEMLVVADDFNLPLGRLRLRPDGSDGGQNGLKSIIYQIGSESFPRLRVGIGPPTEGLDPADFVLSRFSVDQAETVQKTIARAAKAVILAVHRPLTEVMSQFNSTPEDPA
jgi:PTH1 family peptidyl-tRNA hydrolase